MKCWTIFLKRKKGGIMSRLYNDFKAIKCAPGENAEIVTLNEKLENLQEAVGGYVEPVYPFPDPHIMILCNEEGKLEGLPISRPLLDDKNNIYDLIAGTCYIVKCSNDGQNYIDMTKAQYEYYGNMFKYPIDVYRVQYTDVETGEKRTVIDFTPFNGDTGRKVRAYGR